jgi:hypothetical protein
MTCVKEDYAPVSAHAAIRRGNVVLRHRITLLVAALLVTCSGIGVTSASGASAASGPIFTVMNTSETLPDGVWFRRSPHTADTDRVTGHGVYRNERVQLECYAWGDPVGPYSNRLWYYVLNVTRPTNAGVTNQGYLNAHYINDGKLANQPDAVPQCGAAPAPAPPPPPPPPSGPKSVFFSPNETPDAVPGLTLADLNLVLDQWAAGNCSASAAANIPSGVSTLAGWSVGRLGPIYFLDTASAQQVSQVHTIILFDPGSTVDFAEPPLWKRLLGKQTCDWQYSINSLLANWLRSNGANRLIVLTGKDSEEQNSSGRSTFAGLWKYYFAGIWNQPFASQAQVCDYHNLDHQHVLADFASMVQNPIHGCPTAPGVPSPVAWNP